MFTSCRNSGFTMKFENGWTISVRWSKDNYCERRSWDVEDCLTPEGGAEFVESKDAEIAAC